MTASNSENGTLVLGTDCGLSYEPAETTSSEVSESTTLDADSLHLLARQASCKAPYTTTSTTTLTEKFTSTTTTTATITEAPSDYEFSCPEMEVTNSVGDVLSLDEDCALGLSLASPSTTKSGSSSESTRAASSSDKDNSAANLMPSFFGSLPLLIAWVTLFIALL
ncbi:hypothetical protein BGZ63DRAFT_406721 [Mariannaea sp. PMI_226]|nr:hypothetical protein BGZ63DRAFT_406721 [Mariannaea sp. PMI_226]